MAIRARFPMRKQVASLERKIFEVGTKSAMQIAAVQLMVPGSSL